MKLLLEKTRALFAGAMTISALSVTLLPASPASAQSSLRRTGRILTSVLTLTSTQTEPAQDDAGDETTLTALKQSRIAQIRLPEGALLFTGKKQTDPLTEALGKFAKQNKVAPGTAEVLVWQSSDAIQKSFADFCTEAGYQYKAQPTLETDDGNITLFSCVPEQKESKKSSLFGFWGGNGRTIVLTWAVVKPDEKSSGSDSATKKGLPNAKGASTGKPEEKENTRAAAEITGGKVPADLLGEWSWTTISSVNYLNTTTNQLAEPSGMSARFTFSRDGRYKKFFYIRQRTYSIVTESTTTEEGTVTFGDGTFTMHPEKGYYKGHTGSRLIDRPMTSDERKVTTYRWEWRKEDGARRLYIGPDAQSLRQFKPAK